MMSFKKFKNMFCNDKPCKHFDMLSFLLENFLTSGMVKEVIKQRPMSFLSGGGQLK